MMLVDLTTYKEDKFKALMSDFYTTYRDSTASTSDFRKIVEKHVGGDMRWFFDQWIYGTEVPTLKCTKKITKMPTGKINLTITVEQKNVSKPFILVLPFEINYNDGSKAAARLTIDGMKKEFSYILDREPSTVIFDRMESLLCPIEE
jgi:aminopeptidase N